MAEDIVEAMTLFWLGCSRTVEIIMEKLSYR